MTQDSRYVSPAVVCEGCCYYEDGVNPCPSGWHVPSSSEFSNMINYYTAQTIQELPVYFTYRKNAATGQGGIWYWTSTPGRKNTYCYYFSHKMNCESNFARPYPTLPIRCMI